MPSKNVAVALVAAVLLAAGVFWLVKKKADDDPATLIRAQLHRAAQAAEKQDLSGVMAVVSEEFQTPNLARDDLKRVLFMKLRSEGWRKVVLLDIDIRMEKTPAPQRAKVTLEAVLAKGESKDGTWRDLAPTEATIYRFDFDFALEEDDQWRIRQAAYRRASLTGEP